MNLEFTNGQAVLSLSQPRELEVIKVAAIHYADRLAAAELAKRTYHMGSKPTPGRGYDDRLTMRMGLSASTCYELLKLDPKRGGLRGQQTGNRWRILEEDVLEYDHRLRKQAA